ncbi:prephenate dehydratase [Candidatus Woesearchaeota archaeon]|nr:prephenate dehydratase [Candidatus Woesearchaeota archaeon]
MKGMTIATLGPEGTFSHEAALKFNGDSTILFQKTVWDVFDAVNRNNAEMGVVPLENSVSGSVGLTLDALMEFNLEIVGEAILQVRHHLAGLGSLKTIRTLYVQQHTYEQCEKFIRENLAHAELKITGSNADSAKSISGVSDTSVAAVVPSLAIPVYKLHEIKSGIQDHAFNTTRFIAISKTPNSCSIHGRNKDDSSNNHRTSLAVHPFEGKSADKPGVLYGMLGSFAKRSINLTKIESRPSKGKLGDYIFFIDIEGNSNDNKIKEAVAEIEKDMSVKVLGSYPRAY